MKFLRCKHLKTLAEVWNSSEDIRPELYLSPKCHCAMLRKIKAAIQAMIDNIFLINFLFFLQKFDYVKVQKKLFAIH